ncbi:MAG: hypothetical protein GY832_26700 [Chloroflexi bacterium]|nr:hypothetical protein [Chloroflexota bacterium]
MVKRFILLSLVVVAALLILSSETLTAITLQPAPPTTPMLGKAKELAVSFDAPDVADRETGITSSTTPVTDTPDIELVGQIGGDTRAVVVSGTLAYAGIGPRLVVLDISDPVVPVVMGRSEVLPDFVYGIAVAGNYAYVADKGSGLYVIDISDLAAPAVVGSYDTPGMASEVAVAGNYAYIADGSGGLLIVNISNPAAPVWAGLYNTRATSNVAVVGDYAYIATGNRLYIIDISTPSTPHEVGDVRADGASDVAVTGSYAYASGSMPDDLHIIDVSNPADPVEVGLYPMLTAYDVTVVGNYAYVASGSDGLNIIDVSIPMTPTLAGSCDTPGFARGLVITGSYAYVADGRGVHIINVSNPANPAQAGLYATLGAARGVTVVGNYAYVANGDLHIVDVSNPGTLTETAFYETPAFGYDVAVDNNLAYVADGDSGLHIVNVSNPSTPTMAGFYDTLGTAQDIVVAGDYAYVADGPEGLRIIDVSTPGAPVETGFYDDASGNVMEVAVAGNYAYIAAGSLYIVNVSNPAAPTEVASYSIVGSVNGVTVAGNYAYLASYPSLHIVDVSNPVSPTHTGSYTLPDGVEAVAVAGDYAYIADWDDHNLYIVDVSDPVSPTLVSLYNTLWYINDVVVEGNYIYVANSSGGLFILRFVGAEPKPPTGVTIDGSIVGMINATSTFTATVNPTATTPITYIWKATGQVPVMHTGGRSDTVNFAWMTAGLKTITVTATNVEGTVTDTHSITITPSLWTVMVYLSGDNNLDRWTDDLFNNLEAVADNPNVHIVVLWDRHPGEMWDPGTCRYVVQFDDNSSQLFPYTEGVNRWCLGELNTGDKQTLADFVTWAKVNYPANHYFLSIFDHGGGWAPEFAALQPVSARGWSAGGSGVSWDDTDIDYLSNYDLGWVFDNVGHVDVVFYDACLMAMLESAREISGNADYLVASQSLKYATVPYDRYISTITETITPASLATSVADIYMASLPFGYSGAITVLQLDEIDSVITAVDNLAQALINLLPGATAREQIASAYLAAQKIDYDSDLVLEVEQEGYVDLYHFAQQIATTISDSQTIMAAQEVTMALEGGFILTENHWNGSPYTNTFAGLHGVSIYLPFGEELYVGTECLTQTLDICGLPMGQGCIKARQYYTTTTLPQIVQVQLAQDTQWDEFVNEFIDRYYDCQGMRQQDVTGVLPVQRLVNILHDPAQRSGIVPIYYVYLPVILKGY